MEFNLTLKSSREPASTTEDGTWFHSLMDLGKKECWYVSFLALICLSLVSSCSGVPCCVIVGWFNGNQLMVDLVAHNKCSWCLSCNLSPSMRKFLVPRVRASFISNKCGHFLQYLQYISWVFSSKTTQGNLSIHEFWNVLVGFFLSYLKGYCLLKS